MIIHRNGMTLIEIIVVLIIAGVVVAFSLSNFSTPSEQARAVNARNNLLAIYSAQQNYNNNHGGNGTYCVTGSNPPCDNLANINTALSLNIQDDGTYSYSCLGVACTATRTNSSANLVLTATLNSAVQTGGVNPTCTSTTNNSNWCP